MVHGSRIARDVTEASTPIAVIPAEEIKLSGAMTVDEVLNEQPMFVSATNGGSTANTVPAGSAAGAAYVNLRGFGPTRSLTLVNGRRFAIFGPEQVTDLNTIPTALIKRTEVVTGGSSAVYGSDAITGVINFIMRDDFEGVEFGGQYGMDSSTSTPTYSADLTLGGNFGDARLVIDVASDHPGDGGQSSTIRDRVLQAGITINALPIMTDVRSASFDGRTSRRADVAPRIRPSSRARSSRRRPRPRLRCSGWTATFWI